ncbi:MAG: cation-translocating P-type ATPase [Ferruginibacter sp.]
MNELNDLKGLTVQEQTESRQKHGSNNITMRDSSVFLHVLKDVMLEPMFIFLLITCIIYFFVGQFQEGIIMAVSVLVVAGISLYQEYRSNNAISALKKIAASKASVLRGGIMVTIPVEEIVVGDILFLSEGEIVPADAVLLIANDLSLDEAILTGEAFPVNKVAGNDDCVYRGTLVTSGSATTRVTKVGVATMFGKIGESLQEITILKTPLQKQIGSFVRNMAWIGFPAFLFVVGYKFYQSGDFINAFIHGLTLAMSILPEEIPVAFSTFQALGAFRLLKNNIIVKQPQYVETLGAATVICTDKTGTLTLNSMSIAYLYDAIAGISIKCTEKDKLPLNLVEYAMWSSETDPFDPMEKAIHVFYESMAATDKRPIYKQVHEYPISGKPPMMTHIFQDEAGEIIIAAKGAPEALWRLSGLAPDKIKKIESQSLAYAKEGLRVLGVGRAKWSNKPYPVSQQDFTFEFLGLLAFQDPPKKDMAETIQAFHLAGIDVKMITGDYAETASAIGMQIKLVNSERVLTGDEVVSLGKEQLQLAVKHVSIFARMYPEAKLKVIQALIANGEIVAMTGDGVNDAPALKAAHIGIAMGQRGSEIAKAAASLILVDDDLAHMVQAVEQGRKIYDNLKKAIQYIVSIHIPIILIVTLPLLLGWAFDNIFTPVHVIFLELIMGPTCSIVYENEPIEPGTMLRPPRKITNSFLSGRQLLVSIAQGAMITLGCLGIGYYFIAHHADETTTRSVIFITLLFSNIFLSFSNRSFQYSILQTIQYKNKLLAFAVGFTLFFIVLFLYLPFMQQLFGLATLSLNQIFACLMIAFASTLWIELIKTGRSKNYIKEG